MNIDVSMTEFYKCIERENEQLKQENEELKEEIRQLHNKREPQELYTLFGKPIRYWEMLEQKLEKIKEIL